MAALTLVETLAAYVARTRVADLPADVIARAKLCLLDTLGVAIAGSRDRVAQTVAAHVAAHGTPGRSSVLGRTEKLRAEYAAFANGTAAHVLDWDDGHRPSGDHLGGPVVPAALAMAQEVDADGPALLLAVVLGYDAMGRVGEAVCLPRGGGRYFHGNGVNGVFGAAAAAGKLLGLDDQKMASALAIAGDGASGLREWAPTGADVKGLHVGRADHTGITAAYLAAAGLEGSRTVFEGRSGFLGAISPQPRPERVVMDLGTRFAVIEAGFKLFPCVGTLHLPIEAALALRREHSLDATAVDRIRIGLPAWARSEYEDRQRPPQTAGNARFSMSYVVAAALVDGEVAPRHFTAEKIADPALLRLEARAEFVTDAEANAIFTQQSKDETYFFIPCALEIDAAGRTYRRLVRRPIGYDPLERALSDQQLTAKFRLATRGILPGKKTARLIEWTRGLDDSSQIGELDALLTP